MMLSPSHPLHFSVVRIRDAEGIIVGAGFLGAPGLICTCAHVVADALEIPRETEQPPEQEVHLDFPFLGEVEGTACVKDWVRMEPNEGGGDIAVLRLTTAPPSAARPVCLLPGTHLSGRDFETYGFPRTTDVGQWAYGMLRDQVANGYIQLEGTTAQGYRVQQGYSGTPVWDQRGRGVVGMIVAEDRAPEAKVGFLIPNDLIFHACPNIKPITLRQLFAPLTDGLMGLPGSPLRGVEQFLREYLGTPEQPVPFGGRQEQLAALDHWLADPMQPYALLVAEAGRGKSALLTQWVIRVLDEQRAQAILVPISIRFSTALKSTTMSLLGARLRYLHGVKADLPRDADGWLGEIDIYLREDRSADSPLLIVLDGADEAVDWVMGQDFGFPPEPGRGIKVLVSARSLADCDAAGWLRRLQWQGRGVSLELPLLDLAGVAEVLHSMGDPLAGLVTQVDTMRELHRLSEGDPLLVGLYVEALRGIGERAAFLTSEDLGHLKPGLETYFDQWWNDQRRQWGASVLLKEPAVSALLNLLACARGPLSMKDLMALMEPEGFDYWILEEAVRPLARFVVGDGKTQGYVFNHPRLGQYFYEKLPVRERQAWEDRFLSYGRYILTALTNGEQAPREVSPYLVRYYGAHLERGGAQPDHFGKLVSKGWLQAWEALEGTYDGFLNDLARAWKQAEASGAHAQSTQERGRFIGQQCRYVLIVASIKSLMGKLPPALPAALVDKGVWTPIQGLAYARQIPEGWSQAEALVKLVPHLSMPLRQEALAAAQAITDKDYRAWALARLASYLPESLQATVLQEALTAARMIPDEGRRAEVLARLAICLSESLQATALQETLAAVQAIADEDKRAEALVGLAPYLSAPLLQGALAVAQAITFEDWREWALARLVPFLGERGYGEEALAAVQAITFEYYRAEALVWLAPYLSESLQVTVLQEALATIQAIADEDKRAEALVWLTPHLPESLQVTVLQEALAAAQAITYTKLRAEALVGLAPCLSKSLQVTVLQEVLVVAQETPFDRARARVKLLLRVGELGYGEEALAAAQAITFEFDKAEALVGLAPYLSESSLQEALDAARMMADEGERAKTLVGLAPYLSESLQVTVLQEALASIQTIADGDKQQKALGAMRTIADKPERPNMPAQLVPHPRKPCYEEEALAAAWRKPDANKRREALQEVLASIQAIGGEQSKTRRERMEDLPPLRHPGVSYKEKEFASVRRITDEDWWSSQTRTLAKLLPCLGKLGYGEEALAAARKIPDEGWRAQALMWLAPYLSESLQVMVLQEALASIQAIGDQYRQPQELVRLTLCMEELGYGEEALAAIQTIINEDSKAWALVGLAPRLSESLQQKAVAIARTIADENSKAWVLVGLALHLSPSLRATVLQEALATVRMIPDEGRRAKALVGLIPHMKELPVVRLYALWCETLRTLAIHTRSDLFSDIQTLAPVIEVLGGKWALTATALAIIEVGKWFP